MRRYMFWSFLAVGVGACADVIVLPHILEVDGKPVGIASKITGGVRSTMTTPLIGHDPLNISFVPDGNGPLIQRIANSINDPLGRDNEFWTITRVDGTGETFRREFRGARISGLGIPPLDVGSKESSCLTTDLEFETKSVIVRGWDYPKQKQRSWNPSNFTIKIGNLNASRVNKVHAFTIKTKVEDSDGNGVPEVRYESSPIRFQIPFEDSAPFFEWFQMSLEGKPVALPFSLTLFDETRHVMTIHAEMNITSFDFADPFAVMKKGGTMNMEAGGTMTEKAPKIDLNP